MPGRITEIAERFELIGVIDALPDSLPLGMRQRLSLAVAMVHKPELLILDEPTSGVDPIARDKLWQMMADLSRQDHVTIFISTHFMNEAERCDRISLMHAGRVLVCGTPASLIAKRGEETLEAAFIGYLEDAAGTKNTPKPAPIDVAAPAARQIPVWSGFSLRRVWSYTLRESIELRRDPVRGLLALLGTVVLLFIMGYGVSLDVENVPFAALDRYILPVICMLKQPGQRSVPGLFIFIVVGSLKKHIEQSISVQIMFCGIPGKLRPAADTGILIFIL